MHFHNYFLDHIRGDMFCGEGVIMLVLNKEAGVTCYLLNLQGGGGGGA